MGCTWYASIWMHMQLHTKRCCASWAIGCSPQLDTVRRGTPWAIGAIGVTAARGPPLCPLACPRGHHRPVQRRHGAVPGRRPPGRVRNAGGCPSADGGCRGSRRRLKFAFHYPHGGGACAAGWLLGTPPGSEIRVGYSGGVFQQVNVVRAPKNSV